MAGAGVIITGGAGGTTASVNVGEGGNPGYFGPPTDPSFSSIQVGWTVVGEPGLGTVTNIVYDSENDYYLITTSSGSFFYGTSYSFTGGSGITITGGLRIGV